MKGHFCSTVAQVTDLSLSNFSAVLSLPSYLDVVTAPYYYWDCIGVVLELSPPFRVVLHYPFLKLNTHLREAFPRLVGGRAVTGCV